MKKRKQAAPKKKGATQRTVRRRGASADALKKKATLFRHERDEALEQQAATAEILKLISQSSFDLQAVLDAVVSSAVRLCHADMGLIRRREGDTYPLAASFGMTREEHAHFASYSAKPDRGSVFGRAILDRRSIHVPDLLADRELDQYRLRDYAGVVNIRSGLGVPLLREGEVIGVFALMRRKRRSYTRKQIELVETFANQAVIAIENARLLNETKVALERQTATGDILRVISRSPTDVQPVFQAIAEHARLLCKADVGATTRLDGDTVYLAGVRSKSAEAEEAMRRAFPMPLHSASPNIQRALAEQVPVQIPDIDLDPLYPKVGAGFRSIMSVPLIHEGRSIGTIGVGREEPGLFPDGSVALLQTFADQAVIAIQNTRMFNETREALERQTATADVLKVIASSPSNVQPVFDAIATRSNQLIGGHSTAVYHLIDGMVHLAAFTPVSPEADAVLQSSFPSPPLNLSSFFGRAFRGETVHQSDVLSKEALAEAGAESTRRIAAARGFRSFLFVPLTSERGVIGMISVTRKEVGPFAQHHIDLLKTFADQAVIAIQNVALFDEVQNKTRDLEETLQFQTASSDVLKVISRSPDALQPVLDVIVDTSRRLCGAVASSIFVLQDGKFEVRSHSGDMPEYFETLRTNPIAIDQPGSVTARAASTKRTVHVPNTANDPEFAQGGPLGLGGARAMLSVPLLHDGRVFGCITLRQTEENPFTARQIEAVETFADQAVIAISNVNLFEQVQERTRQLSESLDYQTATGDVLNVISRSPSDLQPVMTTIVHTARRLCEAEYALILHRHHDNTFRIAAHSNASKDLFDWMQYNPVTAGDGSAVGIVAATGQTLHMPDALADARFTDLRRQQASKARTMLCVPLLRGDDVVGAIFLARTEVRPFTERQVDLVTNFANQAVIAISNVNLFDQVQAKTRELTEALTYQTGSASILSVIASSPTDVTPVLKAIVESACDVCEAYDAVIFLKEGDNLRFSAHHGPIPFNLDKWPINRRWVAGRALLDQKPVHVHDVQSMENDEFADAREMSLRMGHRTTLSVPLLREGESIGAIALRRQEVNPFSAKQVALLQTFADQAVIAIQNARLFNETREALERQTATSEVLKIVSASLGELEPVFQAILENAVRLCEARFAMLFLYEKDSNEFRAVGRWNLPPAYSEFLDKNAIRADPKIPLGRTAITKQPAQVADILVDQSYIERHPGIVAVAEDGGARTLLQVPLLMENELVGTLGIYRQEVRPFAEKQIELVQDFAAQAVIAIENARLLNELRKRTSDLTESLENLRTAQDRLIQTEKLASLGQLTAGIAHEIKNPLNFVNNFAGLSAELIDELNESLADAGLGQKKREDLDELARTLKGNLEKIVQHGQRADSIVKNMLLHSREGSGEQRAVDINAIVDESLNLAYHGARAEKPGFNITLQRKFDSAAGSADLYPQEITRVLLNIISNGFYAANRRGAEAGNGFEPTLSAETRNRGDSIEIRIRDNGIGMPADVKARIFTPFFTTKPPGEGTGLGLSMSHDIVVKQHGGKIDVETEAGAFTEFIITLPRHPTHISTKDAR